MGPGIWTTTTTSPDAGAPVGPEAFSVDIGLERGGKKAVLRKMPRARRP